MKIGIDASRAFLKQKTGVEIYSLEIIGEFLSLVEKVETVEFILYVRKGQGETAKKFLEERNSRIAKVREISFGRFFTQLGLALEMFFDSPEALLVPAHTVPWIHPKNTLVVVHGLEYENCPKSYGLYSRFFHRFFIRCSCRWSKKVIAISQKTKNDLLKFYRVRKEKIRVVHNGFSRPPKVLGQGCQSGQYLLFVGRLEERKNILGIIELFDRLRNDFGYEGKLILAGRSGVGYAKIKKRIDQSPHKRDIVEKGYISEEEKWRLLAGAEVFVFPSFCEGFGLPILEAQSVGVPVVTSNLGPLDEVAGNGKILVDPVDFGGMARLTNRLIRDIDFRKSVIETGFQNVQRFSWEKCAREIWKKIFEPMV